MTSKKRKSKSGGGRGGGGGGAGAGAGAAGGGGGGSGGGSSNSHKRPRFYDRAENGGDSSNNNRHSRFSNDMDGHRGYYDPTTGQFGAFPGLEEDDGEFYGPANDGMDYLKMVRSEAKSVPTLLVAGQQYQVVKPRSHPPPVHRSVEPASDTLNYDEDVDTLNYDDEPAPTLAKLEPTSNIPKAFELKYEANDTPEAPDPAGWYHDGTYTAAPPPPAPTPPPTALSLWHASLLTTFRKFRTSFHISPNPPGFRVNIPPISPSISHWRQQQLWNTYILHTAPTPRTLRAMSQERVIRALEALTHAPRVKKGVQGWWAEWIWGLLVRCEVCLTAEEVSVVRGVGKRALVVRKKLVCEGGWKGRKEEEEEPESDWDGEEPEGWVEPGMREEKEDGEVEEGECDETGLERAKMKAISALMKASGQEEEPIKLESEVSATTEGDVQGNPDAIDLDFDKPEATNMTSEEALSPGPDTVGFDAANGSDIVMPEIQSTPEHDVTEPAQTEPKVAQNTLKGLLDASANIDTTQQDQANPMVATAPAVNEMSEEIKTEPAPSPSSSATVPAPYALQSKKEHTLADTLGALDMVISIVGDFFGQRDLLDEREGQPMLTMV